MRPGFVLQPAAANGLLPYGLSGYVPAVALRWLPLLPLDRSLLRDDVAAALGVRPVQVPAGVLSALVGLTWRARLQALEPGWVDLAFSVPQLDTTRTRKDWDGLRQWTPHRVGRLHRRRAGGANTARPLLRPRTARDLLRRLLRFGPVGDRHLT